MAKLDNFMVPSAEAYTLTEDYRIYIESLKEWLKTNSLTSVIPIEPEVGHLYMADLTSFLLSKNVAIEDHYIVLRVNDMTSPEEFDETVRTLIIPDQQLITRLKSAYRTKMS